MQRRFENFEDILTPRRKETSNFVWVSRELNPKVPHKQNVKLTPRQLKLEVLNSPKIQELMEALGDKKNISKGALGEAVMLILDEIGFNKRLAVIRWLGLALTKICLKVFFGIHVNREAIMNLKSQMGGVPIIYVPSHRSYADFILFSYICFTYDIEIPAIAAGMDFHAMWGMGSVLRDTGAFFMRRSFNDDSLYWDTFREYVHTIVTKGDQGVELFIEGTRSRTGKSLVPKIGLLSMILKAYFNSEVPDILFVPINISYDRILEEQLFAFELLGVPKPKETTSGFFKSLSVLNERYGNIYIDLAEPISAKEFFDGKVDRSLHNMMPKHIQDSSDKEKLCMQELAYKIVFAQQKHGVISTFNLMSVILMNNLVLHRNGLRIDELIKELVWLRSVFQSFGAFLVSNNVKESVRDALSVHKNLLYVDDQQHVQILRKKVVLDKQNITKLKAHALTENTMIMAVPVFMLQLYVNPTLHYIINAALLTLILRGRNQSESDIRQQFHLLRTVFSKEFIFVENCEEEDFNNAMEQMKKHDLCREHSGCYTLGNNSKLAQLLGNLLDPFLLSYCMVLIYLKEGNVSVYDERAILINCQSKLEHLIRNHDAFVHPYSLCLDTLSNCLQSLVGMKILHKYKKDLHMAYEVTNDEITNLLFKLEKYVPLHLGQAGGADAKLKNKL